MINVPTLFKLEGEELKSAEEWIEKQLEKDVSLPVGGERFMYCFIPGGLGTIVKVVDTLLNEEVDVTCMDWW